MRTISYFTIICLSLCSFAQEIKNEKESRLKKTEVPPEILNCLQPYISKKTHYFLEIDNGKKSYEVKFQFKDKKYSVEFNDSLRLEDVELQISNDEIDAIILKKIHEQLSDNQKFKIMKIQRQFSSNKMNDCGIIDQAIIHQVGDIIRYEIEVGLKNRGKWQLFEMTFSKNGEFLFRRKIVERSSDYVFY